MSDPTPPPEGPRHDDDGAEPTRWPGPPPSGPPPSAPPPSGPPSGPPAGRPGDPGYGGWPAPPPPAEPTVVRPPSTPPSGPPAGGPPPPPPAWPTEVAGQAVAPEAPGGPPQLGETLGPYRLEGELARTDHSLVFRAVDTRLGREVAVKVLTGDAGRSTDDAARFGDAQARLARLDSPHVLSVYEHGTVRGHPWVATRLAAAGDLGQMLASRGTMPPVLAAVVVSQVADGLSDLHGVGLVHGDLRPPNVLLRDERPDRMHVYLGDAGTAAGSNRTPADDVAAAGGLLSQVLTGQALPAGSPAPPLAGSDPLVQELNRILGRATTPDPGRRYGSAAELRDDLRSVAGRQQTPTAPPAPPQLGGAPPAPPKKRRGLLIGGVAGAVVLLLVVGGLAFVLLRGSDDSGGGGGGGGGGGEPEAPAAITGDLDGNGFGDVWTVDSFGTGIGAQPALQLNSDGSAFDPETQAKRVGGPAVSADTDGDGTLEVVQVSGSPPGLTALVIQADGSRESASLTVPVSKSNYLDFGSADVDGDGDDDLVLITEDNRTTYSLSVSLMEDGRPQAASRVSEIKAEYGFDNFALGDFDGDGTDDVAVLTTTTRGKDLRLYRGNDGQLEDPITQKLPLTGQGYFFGRTDGGDVDGDGTDELVLASADNAVSVYDYDTDGQKFDKPTVWAAPEAPDDASQLGGLSDVDGDGRPDLVRITQEGSSDKSAVRVLLSTGDSFEEDDAFASEVSDSYPRMVIDTWTYL